MPAQGTGATYGFLQNDFSLKLEARLLGLILDMAWGYHQDSVKILNPDGSAFAAASQEAFIGVYVETLTDLQATYKFLDNGTDYEVLSADDGGSGLLFDLNADTGFADLGSKTTGTAHIVYSQEVDTPDLVVKATGLQLSQGLSNEILPFDQMIGHFPDIEEEWYYECECGSTSFLIKASSPKDALFMGVECLECDWSASFLVPLMPIKIIPKEDDDGK